MWVIVAIVVWVASGLFGSYLYLRIVWLDDFGSVTVGDAIFGAWLGIFGPMNLIATSILVATHLADNRYDETLRRPLMTKRKREAP